MAADDVVFRDEYRGSVNTKNDGVVVFNSNIKLTLAHDDKIILYFSLLFKNALKARLVGGGASNRCKHA